MGEILDKTELLKRVRSLRRQNRKIVFTNGCFDLLHAGHVQCLEQAKDMGDVLVVGLNSDDSVRRLKGPSRPITSQEDRAYVLSALSCVDWVCVFEEDDPLALVALVEPDILAKGGDWAIDDIIGADVVFDRGGVVVSIPLKKGFSTTGIIEKLKKG